MTREWSISSFYNQAWDLTRDHKELWILGLAVVAYTSAGSNFPRGGGGSSSNTSTDESSETQMLEGETVLGTTDSESQEEVTRSDVIIENLTQVGEGVASRITPDVYVLFAVEVLLGIIFVIIWSLVISSWAKASLILGVFKARSVKRVAIDQVAREVVPRIKSLIWLSVFPMILLLLVIALAVIMGNALGAISPVLGGVFAFVGVLVFIYGVFRYIATMIYAERHCVLEKKSGKLSFITGWQTAKGKLWRTLRLGIVNSLAIGLVNLILFIPAIAMAVIAIVPMLRTREFMPGQIVPLVVIFLITLVVQAGVNAVLNVFRYATWQIAYESVTSNGEDS